MHRMSNCYRLMATLALCTALFLPVCFGDPPLTVPAFALSCRGGEERVRHYRVAEHESLVELARRFDLGFDSIVSANPGVDPFVPDAGTMLDIPCAWILPEIARRPAIVINVPEFRLYYFASSGPAATFPLGIGDEGTETPLGSYTVVEKITGPSWHVPASIRATARALPKVVPPGPDNPMGSHALRLSLPSVLIHGTNKPWGIGRRSSHGCLRLYPEDIVTLFKLVPKGTRVEIIHQPLKVAVQGERVFLESHRCEREEVGIGAALRLLADRNLLQFVDFSLLARAVAEKKGLPVEITLLR